MSQAIKEKPGKLNNPYLLIREVIGGDVIQLRDESGTFWVLGAVEDALKDGLVLSVDVVVLQENEDASYQP